MKNIIKYLILTSLLISPIFWSGCDSINKLPLNVPIEFPFSLQQAALTYTDDFCLDDSETYVDYKGDIKKLTLLRVIYRTADEINSVIPAELEGTFEIVIKRNDTKDTLIYMKIEDFIPIDYKKPHKPYELKLTVQEIALVNEYLNSNMQQNPCFTVTITLLEAQSATFELLKGYVDILFEAEVEL